MFESSQITKISSALQIMKAREERRVALNTEMKQALKKHITTTTAMKETQE